MNYLTVENVTPREAARILSKISVSVLTGCWNWTGSFRGKAPGYGSAFFRGHSEAAHRLLYAWFHGPIPSGVSREIPVLDHLCNNPHCCNPEHLELRQQRDNILRGNGACATNQRKTHCPKGHPLPDEPDLSYGPARRCPICLLEKRRARRAQKQAYDRAYRERHKSLSA